MQVSTGINGARERVAKVIGDIDNLPSLPSIVTKLIEVINSAESNAETAAELIEKDPALTSKMIRLANSAFYGIPRSVSSVTSAVVVLGFNTIRTIVLSTSVAKIFEGNHALNMEKFWKHSIVTAMASKTIVLHIMNKKMMDPESAFCAGILHDIGKLILSLHLCADYSVICNAAKERSLAILDVEDKILGINHTRVGSILADKWALPPELENAIVGHHSPDIVDQSEPLAHVVHLADAIAHDLGFGMWDGEMRLPECATSRSILKIGSEDYKKIVDEVEHGINKSQDFLSILE